jgi:tetratricopeptide (TPR) repeat protein
LGHPIQELRPVASSTRIARLVDGVDIRTLPIGPEEAFVISRVDGASRDTDIAHGTGLPEPRVRAVLDRLRELGAVCFLGEPDPAGPTALRAAPAGSSEAPTTMRSPKGKSGVPPAAKTNGKDRPALDDATLLAVEAMLARLDDNDHYQLLGIPRQATKKDIKAAYFTLIARFHPDKYFGAELGEAKAKLERVFARLTEAYDTLTRSQSRSEYDEGLPPASEPPPTRATTASTHEPAAAEPPAKRSLSHGETPSASEQVVIEPVNSLPSLPAARRRALARKLQGSSPSAQQRVSTTLKAVTAVRPSVVRAADTIPAPPDKPAGHHRFLIAADQAMQENNPVAATNALRLALAAKPDDVVIQRRLEEVQLEADVRLLDRLKLDASKALNAGRFSEAAQLFGRAARAGGNADLYLAAAEASQQAQENPKIAADFAKRGLLLAPDHARLRLLLGRIYAEAGMTSSALAELSKAQQLEPSDASIRALLEKVRKA